MDKSILVGLLSALALLLVALVGGFFGLLSARLQYRVNSRTADTAQATATTTADATRILRLDEENKNLRESEGKLRAEITDVWAAIGKLRRDTEAEIETLKAECRKLRDEAGQVPALRATVEQQGRTIEQQAEIIAAKSAVIAARDEKIADLNTLLQVASTGQQMAEGVARQASAQADRLITTLCPSPGDKSPGDDMKGQPP